MYPRIEITVDGTPVAGAFYERLVSATVTDNEGVDADTIDIELNDGPPHFLAIPRTGAIIDVRLGYGTVRSLGQYTVDKVTVKCFPFSMQIGGKSADLRRGKLKERQERHWDNTKLKDIIGDLASESELSAAVDSEIGDYEYDWLGQQDESNLDLLRRLASRHNAILAVKSGRLVFAKRGSAKTPGGNFMGSVVVTPSIIVNGTTSGDFNDRTKYKKVVAYHQDRNRAERVEIDADSDADGDSVFRIQETFGSLAEADKAAQSKAKELRRGEASASVTVVGDTAIVAGAPLLFSGVRVGLDGVPFMIKTATHTFSKAGYTTAISATMYDGKSATEDLEGDNSPASANDNAAGVKAPNTPPAAPAVPSQWTQRRYGGTDAN